MTGLKENQAQNLISGFAKCGIYPLDRTKLLERLPKKLTEDDVNYVWESFLEQLKKKRCDYVNPSVSTKKKRKKLDIAAGKGISPRDLSDSAEDVSSPQAKQRPSKKKKIPELSSSDEDVDEPSPLESEEDVETFSDFEEALADCSSSTTVKKKHS